VVVARGERDPVQQQAAARRTARSPARGGTQVAERQAQQRLQLIGPRQHHRPGPGQDQPRRLDTRQRLADPARGRPRSRPVPAAPGTQRPAPLRYRQRACSASCSAAPGSRRSSASPASARRCSMAKRAGRIPAAAPPHQRHRPFGGVSQVAGLEPGSRPHAPRTYTSLTASEPGCLLIEAGSRRSGRRRPEPRFRLRSVSGNLSGRYTFRRGLSSLGRAGVGVCPVPFSGAWRRAGRCSRGPARRVPAEATGCRAGSLR
jgi:hypothetical protein